MNRRDEAIRLLKESKAIKQAVPGCRPPLVKPSQTDGSTFDDRWVSTVALYYATAFHNVNEGGPTSVDIDRLSKRVKKVFGINDSEIG